MFRRGMAPLAAAGFHVLAPDLRGFGISDKPTSTGSYTLDAYVADLLGLLDACGLQTVGLVAHSMAGAIGLHAALRHGDRVRRLVLVNPVGLAAIPALPLRWLVPQTSMDLLGRRAVPRWMVGWILRRIAYARPGLVSERDVDEYWAPSQFHGYAHALRATLGDFTWSPLARERLLSLAAPTALVLGSADRLVSADASAQAASGVASMEVTTLAGGHCVHEELPELVYPLIALKLT
jgi:pimeloyl-ACP methyl ester carboxylesterase